LARALVIQPKVLLMDEPLSNLDAKLRLQVRETIVELQREAKITTVFVTHDREEALAMSDRIGVMNQGRLEQVGTPAQIYREPRTGYVADFVGGANIIAVETAARQAGETATIAARRRHHHGARRPPSQPARRRWWRGRTSCWPSLARPAPCPAGSRIASISAARPASRSRSTAAACSRSTCNGAHDRFEPGASVGLGFDPARTLVLAS
jgi:iron(III) transport system ATP-binding protein